jgi:hypothetical protein
MADNKIQLDLELNKDSVVRSFDQVEKQASKSAKESADFFNESFREGRFSFNKEIDGAFENFKKNNKDVVGSALGGTKAVGGLANIAAGVYLLKEAFDILKVAATATINTILEGEKEIKLEQRFVAISEAAGVTSSVLQNDLKNAIGGFLDDSALLSLASEAFIKIGKNAEALPRAISVARKAYEVFGGDIVEITDKIISATETGNSRSLRSIGLYTDLDAAVKQYARTQGINVKFLTEQQKEQARLNAILEIGEQRFSNVQIKAGATSSYIQLKTALKELSDEFSKLTNSKLGSFFAAIADSTRSAVESISNGLRRARPAETAADITVKLEALRNKASQYEAQLKELGTGSATLAFAANLKGQLILVKEQIANYDELRRKLNSVATAQAANGAKGNVGAGDAQAEAARLEARKAALAKIQELNIQAGASEVALSQNEFNTFKQRADLERLFLLQKTQANEEYKRQQVEQERFFNENGAITQTERDAADEALRATHLNKLLLLQETYNLQKRQLLNDEAADVTTFTAGLDAALQGVSESLRTQTTSMRGTLKELGKSFVTTFKSQATNAIFAFAQGSKNAEEAAQGLFTGILNAMGEMLISQGLGFILQGAAFTFAGLPNGGALAAAGAAMVAFGAGIAAVSAANGGKVGGASGDAAGGGSAGGQFVSDIGGTDLTKPVAELEPTTPKAEINVNVGQVFDRKETGMWIADILDERFKEDGILVSTHSVFYYGIQITADNRYINFKEGAGAEKLAVLPIGTYSHTKLSEIVAAALNLASALTWSVSISRVTRLMTINSSGTASLLWLTGTSVDKSAHTLLGYPQIDLNNLTTFVGALGVGKEYKPQYLLQDYKNKTEVQKLINATVNKSASKNVVSVQHFGVEQFYKFNIKYITNRDVRGSDAFLKNNQSAVEEAKNFLQWITQKYLVEFMPDEDVRTVFDRMYLDTAAADSDGVGYELTEYTNLDLPEVFETGLLTFTVISKE